MQKYKNWLSNMPWNTVDSDRWSTPRPGRFPSWTDWVLFVQDAMWNPGPVWVGVKYLFPTRLRAPNRPARTEPLYRLRSSDPTVWCM